MQTVIEASWDKEVAFAAALPAALKNRIVKRVALVAEDARRGVKIDMPVDTGAARASWGTSPSPAPADASDGIWAFEDGGMTNVQGSRRGYIAELNEGSSKQAPAGFIDARALSAELELNDGINADIGEVWR